MHKDVLRLAGLLAAVALATSRFGLIGHELVGHGGAALACGARIDDVQLFWFAGGWIRYHLASPDSAAALLITMAGIALEITVGTALALLARRNTLGRRILRGIGLALVLHASWYLATGAFHGFGDGLLLYRKLGAGRVPVAIAAGALTCVVGYLGAREVLGALAGTIRGSRRAQIAGTAIALLLAGGLHAVLTAGELRVRRDPTYTATMRPERERVIAQEMAQWQKEQPTAPTPQAQRAEQVKLEQTHRTFPFVYLLALATAIAVLLGAWRAKPAPERAAITNRLLFITVTAAVAAIGLVITIDAIVR